MDKNLILKDLNQSTTDFLETINNSPVEHFNTKPDTDAWSAAEVIEHVVKVERLLNIIIQGKKESIEERQSDLNIDVIKTAFQNYDKKYTAYGPIIPEANSKDRDELVINFEKNRIKLKELIKSEDLSLVCLDFKHGVFGELTVLEWIYIIIYHSKRHAHQIRNIKISL